MKKLSLSIILLLLALSLTGCGASSKDLSDSAEKANQELAAKSQEPSSTVTDSSANQQGIAAGEPNPSAPGNGAGTPSTSASSSASAPQNPPPHAYGDFQGAGQVFSGGDPKVKDYNLTGIRRVPHPTFYRMVFDFGLGETGAEAAASVPGYQVTMGQNQQLVTLDLSGVNWAAAKNLADKIAQNAPLISKLTFEPAGDQKYKVIMDLKEKAVFQVFDLPNPARVVVVMAPTEN